MERSPAARVFVLVELALMANVVRQLRLNDWTRGTRRHGCANLVWIACRPSQSLRITFFDTRDWLQPMSLEAKSPGQREANSAAAPMMSCNPSSVGKFPIAEDPAPAQGFVYPGTVLVGIPNGSCILRCCEDATNERASFGL